MLKEPSVPDLLPNGGRVYAVIVGVEQYQSGRFPAVKYARADAESVAELLDEIYGARLECEVFTDDEATKTTLDYRLRQATEAAGASDLFVFFYAGHGYYANASNRLTAYDTGAMNILDTSVSVMDTIVNPLAQGPCGRALLFIDACAHRLSQADLGRAAISDIHKADFDPIVNSEDYCAVFLSCKRGESSYPSSGLQHGIWTYHLLQALRGEAAGAMAKGSRIVTDASLRDYLRAAVPRYIREETTIKERQTPEAVIRASGTFAIRIIPEQKRVPISNDLSMLGAPLVREYFEGYREGPVRNLQGFKPTHKAPKVHDKWAEQFVVRIAAQDVSDELEDYYQKAKRVFSLRRKDLKKSESPSDASGTLDSDYFRILIFAEQHPDRPDQYRITRQLEVRQEDDDVIRLCDAAFGRTFDRLVLTVDDSKWNFDEIVDRFEEFAEDAGGTLTEDDREQTLEYTSANGMVIEVNVAEGTITLSCAGERIPALLERARSVRFGLTGDSKLALT